MTLAPSEKRSATWPLPLVLTKQENSGAQAQGCVVARSSLSVVAERLAPRAQRYASLRLTLGHEEAVFWSTKPWQVNPLRAPEDSFLMTEGQAQGRRSLRARGQTFGDQAQT